MGGGHRTRRVAAGASVLRIARSVGGAPLAVHHPTDAAIWWHDRQLGQWEINRQLAVRQRLGRLETARMLAMVNVAVADANIACFNDKEAWGFWRPLTAIRLADTDGNPRTTADPTWNPLVITSPDPEFPSGHACATTAAMLTLAFFFGRDDLPFSAFSPASGTRRHFAGFSRAIAEVLEARIWGGIHFRSAVLHGATIGVRVALHLTGHGFRRSQ
jgi:hypothetical protein